MESLSAFTPELELQTLFVLNEQGRIVSTREPKPTPGPGFFLIRGSSECAWALHASVPDHMAARLETLAREEPPAGDFHSEPAHATQYISIVGGRLEKGPAFTFPDRLAASVGIAAIEDLSQLEQNFRGWSAEEIPGCSPILGVLENGDAISICFCARRSPLAAEAGVETAPRFRGRGLGPRVTAAWALAIRASGRLPIYSTSWDNGASLAVARKLNLRACASHWSLSQYVPPPYRDLHDR
jgi:hypothetical protein